MRCAYCGREGKATKEHIIPGSIIELFPECVIVVNKDRQYIGESVIKDVCSVCNNGPLSDLDSYGKSIIEKFALVEYEGNSIITFEYEYKNLSRWLLKIVYNQDRANKEDISWYESNMDYILYGKEAQRPISLFGGLWVNVSPIPSSFTDNMMVHLVPNPGLFPGGILNEVTYKPIENTSDSEFEPSNIFRKFVIRFGSLMFLLFLWDKDVDKDYVTNVNKLIKKLFPYKLLTENENTVELERCTSAFNCHYIPLVIGNVGLDIESQCVNGLLNGRDPIQLQKNFYD